MTAVVFATCRKALALQPSDTLAAAALEARGFGVVAAPWNGPFEPFERADAIIVRSTWDYPQQPARFEKWLASLASVRGRVVNAPSLMLWNLPKTYLLDLASKGASTPPTMIVDPNAAAIERAMASLGVDEAVVKPIIGATASGLSVVRRGDQRGLTEAAERLGHRALVQPVIRDIERAGETSMMFFARRYSHSVVKRPAAGDIRSQAEFGGRIEASRPPNWAVADAARILEMLPERPVYARVDAVILDEGFLLMEVELIEPELFLTHDPGAAARFAEALIDEMKA